VSGRRRTPKPPVNEICRFRLSSGVTSNSDRTAMAKCRGVYVVYGGHDQAKCLQLDQIEDRFERPPSNEVLGRWRLR